MGSSDPVVVTIPGTPDKCLSPNNIRSERHWAPRAKVTKQARHDAYYACRNANVEMWEPDPPITIHAVIGWEKGRRGYDPDAAHAMLKPYIDGIADAIGIDDKHITLATVTQDRDAEGKGFVKVAIEQETRA
jgi:crossover junction endodeoxyribonuclease RusA